MFLELEACHKARAAGAPAGPSCPRAAPTAPLGVGPSCLFRVAAPPAERQTRRPAVTRVTAVLVQKEQ